MLEWIFEPPAFGDLRIMLEPITPQLLLQLVIGMKVKNAVPMRNVFKVEHGPLVFSVPLVAWVRLLLCCISTLQVCYMQSGIPGDRLAPLLFGVPVQ